MAGKQAKVLSEQEVEDLLFFANTSRNPDRNRVIILLSIKAGLRAGEIANLTWDMVTDAMGNVSPRIELRDHAAKMGSRSEGTRLNSSHYSISRMPSSA